MIEKHRESLKDLVWLVHLAREEIKSKKPESNLVYGMSRGKNLIINTEISPQGIFIRAEHPNLSPELIEESMKDIGYTIKQGSFPNKENRTIYQLLSEHFLLPEYVIVTNGNNKGIEFTEEIKAYSNEIDNQTYREHISQSFETLISKLIISLKDKK